MTHKQTIRDVLNHDRDCALWLDAHGCVCGVTDAVTALAALVAERDKLREALERIKTECCFYNVGLNQATQEFVGSKAMRIIDEALAQKENE